ncbi:nucleotide sugar dehydrogenase [Alteribacillus sp. HJP-4]|uniref:nucleotide sugar dehydrogenase n=1 Tax=Alteribacillus sp. HJP-4 TaxID=2775394 RepID=UPI0035CD2473
MNEILVTGCAGFIGFHMAKRLLEEGHTVVGVDNLNTYYEVQLKKDRLSQLELHERFTFYKVDIKEKAAIEQIFSNHQIDRVIHLAAQAGVRYSLDHPDIYVEANVQGFLNILEACRHQEIKHLLYASSSSVYGANSQLPFSVEQRVDEPLSLYAATKRANELMAHTYSHLFNIPSTGLRFFTVYGPWGRPDMALFHFTKSILNEKTINIFNDGSMKRDFTYIDDIIEGIYRLLPISPVSYQRKDSFSIAPAKVYNIGNNQPVELMAFIETIEKKLGKKAKKKYLPLQPGDVTETFADVGSLSAVTGFKPSTSINEGVGRFVEWYLNYYEKNSGKVGVVGLGYVGLPTAVAFGEKEEVIGLDCNKERIAQLNEYQTGEVEAELLQKAAITFTTDAEKLKECNFIIVTVPAPINKAKQPDLSQLRAASRTVGSVMQKGTTIVYESTVYPGATEEVCIPILENVSKMKAGRDFYVGYSPERIHSNNKTRTINKIDKMVAGQNERTTETVAAKYLTVVEKVNKASSIKVAEAAKVIENTQRDLNIALMNELSIIFNNLQIDTKEVLEASRTKWNPHFFSPGLVGGHCIGVDPYYLIYKAEMTGFHPQVIQAGRRTNDFMPEFIVQSLVKQLMLQGKTLNHTNITVLGATFKENVTDIHNSKVADMINCLKEYGMEVQLHEPAADPEEIDAAFGIYPISANDLKTADAVILAVPHRWYLEQDWIFYKSLLHEGKGRIIDIKGALDPSGCPEEIKLWKL